MTEHIVAVLVGLVCGSVLFTRLVEFMWRK